MRCTSAPERRTALTQQGLRGQGQLLVEPVELELQFPLAGLLDDLVNRLDRAGLHAHADQGGRRRSGTPLPGRSAM